MTFLVVLVNFFLFSFWHHNRMFQIAPDAWSVFPWGRDIRPGENLAENRQFVCFAANFVSMLDMAIDMLGPDLEEVEEQLAALGTRHVAYGVMPSHYPLMGKALIGTLEHLLGPEVFNDKIHESWNGIFSFMSMTMMQGAFIELIKIARSKTASTRRRGLEKGGAGDDVTVSTTESTREDDLSSDDESPGGRKGIFSSKDFKRISLGKNY